MSKDLTQYSHTQRLNIQKSQQFWMNVVKCLPVALLATAVMTLISLFLVDDFLGAFTKANGFSTAGKFLANFLLFALLFMGIYGILSKPKSILRKFSLIVFIIGITYIATLICVKYLNVYAMPIVFVMLLIAELIDRKSATYSTVVLSMFLIITYIFVGQASVSFTVAEAVGAVICNAIGAITINFVIDQHLTRIKFLGVALLSSLLSLPFIVFSTIASGDLTISIIFNMLWSYGASVASIMLFMPSCAILESIFNVADDFKLSELCNFNNPLLKRLASEAPGTFNHSLVVGNLAEACAEAIGENPQLARCAAYYHDIGKLKAPVYFSENQTNYNPHDELIPEVSVSMITSHTLFGEILAKQNKLPPEIVAICREHHGTAPVGYFYRKALTLTEEGDLAVDKFTYSGPKPQTKVSAIIMIADTIEAALRAYSPETREDYILRINKLVDEKLDLGQFDECPITLKDIATIKSTIAEVLPSIQHTRISYEKKRK